MDLKGVWRMSSFSLVVSCRNSFFLFAFFVCWRDNILRILFFSAHVFSSKKAIWGKGRKYVDHDRTSAFKAAASKHCNDMNHLVFYVALSLSSFGDRNKKFLLKIHKLFSSFFGSFSVLRLLSTTYILFRFTPFASINWKLFSSSSFAHEYFITS